MLLSIRTQSRDFGWILVLASIYKHFKRLDSSSIPTGGKLNDAVLTVEELREEVQSEPVSAGYDEHKKKERSALWRSFVTWKNLSALTEAEMGPTQDLRRGRLFTHMHQH